MRGLRFTAFRTGIPAGMLMSVLLPIPAVSGEPPAPAGPQPAAAKVASPAPAGAPTPLPGAPPPGIPAQDLPAPAPLHQLALDDAVRRALAMNPTIEQAMAAIQRAEAVVAEARSFQLPRLNADARLTLQGPIPSFTFTLPPEAPGDPPRTRDISLGKSFTRQFGLSATYDVDPFGRLRAQTEIARRQVGAARGELFTTRNELVFAVQNLYLAALRAGALVGVQQEAVEAAREQLRVTEAELRAGTAPEFDVLRARVQVENIRQNLVQARSTEQRSLAALSRLLSLEPNAQLRLEPVAAPADAGLVAGEAARRILAPAPAAGLPPHPQSLESALEEAFTRRPELYRAEWARRAAEARVAFERRGRLPALGITASALYTPDAAGFARVTRSWSILAYLTIPIWDAGQARARTRQAEAEIRAAEAQLRTARDLIAEEVKQSLIDLEAARERRGASASNAEQAREALRIARVRYMAGLASGLEVIDAEAALVQARANEVNADHDYLASLAALNRSLGRYAGSELNSR